MAGIIFKFTSIELICVLIQHSFHNVQDSYLDHTFNCFVEWTDLVCSYGEESEFEATDLELRPSYLPPRTELSAPTRSTFTSIERNDTVVSAPNLVRPLPEATTRNKSRGSAGGTKRRYASISLLRLTEPSSRDWTQASGACCKRVTPYLGHPALTGL